LLNCRSRRMDGHRTDAEVNLYSVLCCTLHWSDWTDNETKQITNTEKKTTKCAAHAYGKLTVAMWSVFLFVCEKFALKVV